MAIWPYGPDNLKGVWTPILKPGYRAAEHGSQVCRAVQTKLGLRLLYPSLGMPKRAWMKVVRMDMKKLNLSKNFP